MIMVFESPELEALARDLIQAEERVVTALRPVVKRAAQNIKADAQARVQGFLSSPTHLPHVAPSITYDEPTVAGGTISTEVGPAADTLARGMEFGSVHTSPRPFMMPATDEEEPKLEEAVADAAVRVLS